MGPIDGPVAPLWVPFAAALGIFVWIFVWYFVIDFLVDLGASTYIRGIRIDAPKWQRALSYALGVPALIFGLLGGLGLGAVLIVSIGSIVTH